MKEKEISKDLQELGVESIVECPTSETAMTLSASELEALERQAAQEDARGLRLAVKKIKIPTGGSTFFDLGDGKPVNDLIGVIIDNYDTRSLFLEDYSGSDNPPDCQSTDCITGTDKDGNSVSCESCGLWRYKKDSTEKRCTTRRRLYILLEGHDLPYLLVVPPTSMTSFRHYVELLQYNNHTTRTVLTRIWLKAEKSTKGFPYAQLQFAIQKELSGADRAEALVSAKALRELTRPSYFATPEAEAEESEPEFVPEF